MGVTRSYGGGMYICPDANHHDGLLDVTIMGRLSRTKAVWKFRKIFTGDIRDEEGLEMYRTKRARIMMSSINGYADGDKFTLLPMEVEAIQGAGKFLVPRPRIRGVDSAGACLIPTPTALASAQAGCGN